ncbi:SufD family Fe-S cluster assembly protein [Sandaracinobacteroides saxicola]|uniref:SufD family Fe-S cluster assembly protein n=1 Tax=Sandaracinobacteroides saxicola TaxID=2759707 RepID=A0A7G5IG54_9SPHN|nr:SufD family Fe-S cluster assembly protein [Sandaracinobacteroides saxicola]QMW22346.1 SufD family Fe-S cluster assembly protein [Sandaracinobacteroides saxicola]
MIALPSRKTEGWRWADLRLAGTLGGEAPPANDDLPALNWLAGDTPQLLIVGGRLHHADNARFGRDPDRALPAHPLADIAAAEAQGGLIWDAQGDAGIVQVTHLATGGAAHVAHRIRVAAGARATLVEQVIDQDHDAWSNLRLDAEVAEGGSLERILLISGTSALNSERVAVTLAAHARFRQTVLVAGGSSARIEAHVMLAGEGAHADIDGVMLGTRAQAFDALTRLTHAVPGTSSAQKWRLVAGGQAQVSVSGGVTVAPQAQKTDAEQSLRGLVLARTAAVNVKPELEIFADDVKCAHGCAIGELDRAALFYLQSRGLPRMQAQALLTSAFIADGLAGIGPEGVRTALQALAEGWAP